MKIPMLIVGVGLICLFCTHAAAKLSDPRTLAQSRAEQCALALNQYLVWRRGSAHERSVETAARLERQARVVCKGLQVKLEQHNGRTVGTVVESR